MRWTALALGAFLMISGLGLAAEKDKQDRAPGRFAGPGDAKVLGEDGAHERGPRFLEHADKWILRNDNVTIWFHQGDHSKPVLSVFRTGEDGNKTGFRLALDEIFEAKSGTTKGNASAGDDEGDEDEGAQFHRVRAHRVNLHPAKEWWTDVHNGSDEVTITMSHLFNQGNVTLVFHVPLAGGHVKFDVQVKDWKWADANDRLALRLKVLSRGAERHGDSAAFAGGQVSWASTASVTYPNGTTATIPVEGAVQNHGEGARIILLFNGTGGYNGLDYDPTISIAGAGNSQLVPGPGPVAALAVLGVAALVATRRRR